MNRGVKNEQLYLSVISAEVELHPMIESKPLHHELACITCCSQACTFLPAYSLWLLLLI